VGLCNLGQATNSSDWVFTIVFREILSSYKSTIKQITYFRLHIHTCSTVLVISSHSILHNLLYNERFHERTSGFKIYVFCDAMPCRQMSSPPTFRRILQPSLQGQAVYFDCAALNVNAIRPFETTGATDSLSQRHISEDLYLQRHWIDKLKSQVYFFILYNFVSGWGGGKAKMMLVLQRYRINF